MTRVEGAGESEMAPLVSLRILRARSSRNAPGSLDSLSSLVSLGMTKFLGANSTGTPKRGSQRGEMAPRARSEEPSSRLAGVASGHAAAANSPRRRAILGETIGCDCRPP